MTTIITTAWLAVSLIGSLTFAKVSETKGTVRIDTTYYVSGNACLKVTDTWDAKSTRNSIPESELSSRSNSKPTATNMTDCYYAIKNLGEGCFVVSRADDKMRPAPMTQCDAHVTSPDGWEPGPSELKGHWQLKTKFSLPFNPKEGTEKSFQSNKEFNNRFFNDPIVCKMKLMSEPTEPMNLVPRTLFLERVAVSRNEKSIVYFFDFIQENPQDATKKDFVKSLTCIVPHKSTLSDTRKIRVDEKVLDGEEDLRLILNAVDIELITPARQVF